MRRTVTVSMVVVAVAACRREAPAPEPGPALPSAPRLDAGRPAAEPLSFPKSGYASPPSADAIVVRAVRGVLRSAAADPQKAATLGADLRPIGPGRTRALLDALDDPSLPRSDRRLALVGLAALPDARALPRAARACVRGDDADFAAAAADVVIAIGDPLGAAALEALARRTGLARRRLGALALGKLGEASSSASSEARASLRRLLSDEDGSVREAALRGLVSLGSADDVPWFDTRVTDGDALVRRRAIEGLARHGGPAQLPRLVTALDDPFGPVAAAAAQGLRRLADPRAVPYLVAYLASGKRTSLDPVLAAVASFRDPSTIRHVVPFLFDRDGYLRASAATALAEIGDPAAIPHLVAALSSEMINARSAAAAALGRFGASAVPAVPALNALLTDDQHPQVQAAVRAAVAAIGPVPAP